MIEAHGGQLVNRVADGNEKQEILNKAPQLKRAVLSKEQITDSKNIAFGIYSPLTGFLKKNDFERVVKEMRLADGTVWPIPIVLDINQEKKQELLNESKIILLNEKKQPIGILENPEIYSYNKEELAQNVFGTTDKNHPGVEAVFKMKEFLLGGEVKIIDENKDVFPEFFLTPQETREIFKNNNWEKIVAFQTRNVPHRGHEFLQKYGLSKVDGLFIQPVIGEKKLADFKDEFILGAYQLLVDKFFDQNKVVLGILPLKMRYAGPREALMHALIRKNFGCSHFIVGRDHAGVGDYYGPFEAQEIFSQFKPEEIGIKIIKAKKVVWCPQCCEFVFENQCPHKPEKQISFSGTKIRQSIEQKKEIPPYFMRPEIYQFLAHSLNPLVDDMYNNQIKNMDNKKGFVLWFTGLSGSGKSVIADLAYQKLKEMGKAVERLDGDIVRQTLTRDLGFSKEDRDENIKRISFVASALSRNGVGVLASFISPYQKQREGVRQSTENFIEVYCQCPLGVCEERDIKGLYAKARIGQIQNFTGISDPYEEPENPEIVLDTSVNTQENVEKSAQKVIDYLEKNDLL